MQGVAGLESSSVKPMLHETQGPVLLSGSCEPAKHVKQGVLALRSLSTVMPVQLNKAHEPVLLAGTYVPQGQGMHAVVGELSSSVVPAAHMRHAPVELAGM